MEGTDGQLGRESGLESACFAQIFERHFDAVHGYLNRRLGRVLADDLAGEVFRIAFESRARFDPRRGEVRPWLFGIATNLVHRNAHDEMRKARALERLFFATESATEEFVRVEERQDAQCDVATIIGVLCELSIDERDALLLYALEDMTYVQVGAALGVPVGTIASQISRVRRRLQCALRGGRARREDSHGG